MNRIHIATLGASDWRRLLADPIVHWKRGASAMELAVSWEYAQLGVLKARGLPREVAEAIDDQPDLSGARLLAAFPEHKVPLEGPGKPSQNDVWALFHTKNGYLSMAVEGKAGEPFGPTIGDWKKSASEGKPRRLDFLCKTLQISSNLSPDLRYQLFHRTASAILEAERCEAPLAVMLVQSFREDPISWNDFVEFNKLLGITAIRGKISEAHRDGSLRLFLGWVDSPVATDAMIASVI